MSKFLTRAYIIGQSSKIAHLIKGNKDGSLVDDFSPHYTMACAVLPNATHIFDEESYVSMEFAKPLNNYIFVDSKSEPLVQLADVWVGFLVPSVCFSR